jgi:DNA-directed RNA polymerase specialized sigma24 family protein
VTLASGERLGHRVDCDRATVVVDFVIWSAREVAELLGDSVASVNSALQRARERVAREHEEGLLGSCAPARSR